MKNGYYKKYYTFTSNDVIIAHKYNLYISFVSWFKKKKEKKEKLIIKI